MTHSERKPEPCDRRGFSSRRARPPDRSWIRSIDRDPSGPAGRSAARSGWPASSPFSHIKPFCGTHPVTPSTRFGLPKLWRRARRLVRQPPQPPLGRPTHVRMERERSSETMQPGSKVAKVECSESSSGGSSPSNSPPAGERCHLAPGLLQEARCPAPSSKPGLRSCGVCSKPVGCSQSSIYMAFDRPFCSTSCREKAVLEHFTRSLPAFDLPPSSNQHFSAVLAG